MLETPAEPQKAHPAHEPPWRDIAAVVGITLLSFVLSVRFNINETLYALTRRGERFQIDELPIGMLVLLLCLMWLSWRRYEHARRELRARRIAEARVNAVLEENRQLAQENLRIQEVERKHLARELHDELRPVGLDELGLVAAIEHCVDHWRQRLPDTRFQLSVRGNFEGLNELLNLTLYRLIQEGLTNIYKHAHAPQAHIALERIESARPGIDELRLSIADDGCGMEPSTHTSRFGLNGMRERVVMAGGTFLLESAPGRGLRFEAHLPADGETNG
jgi:signal transduction histidine kinase